jgi:hypothetical protein
MFKLENRSNNRVGAGAGAGRACELSEWKQREEVLRLGRGGWRDLKINVKGG